MTDFTFLPKDHSAVTSATKILMSRYKDYVEYADVQQELYLWLLRHYDRAQRWRSLYEERHAERTLVKALRNAGERYCRTEKAEYEGYVPDDEFFYSIPMVADLLTLYLDPEWMMPSSTELGTSPSGKPPGEGGNLMAMVADVGRALEGLPEGDQRLLRGVYGPDVVVADAIADLSITWDCTYSAANSRVRRVVGRVRAALGGPDPWKDKE